MRSLAIALIAAMVASAPCSAQSQRYAEFRIAMLVRTTGNQLYVSLDSDKGNQFTCRETASKDAKDDDASLYRACLTKLLQEVAGAQLKMPDAKILIYEPLFLTALSAAGWDVFQSESMNTTGLSSSLGRLYYLRHR
jgi:hypothetical protein